MVATAHDVRAIPTNSITVQVREGSQTESMTVYGGSHAEIMQALFDSLVASGRAVRRKNKLFIPEPAAPPAESATVPAPQRSTT